MHVVPEAKFKSFGYAMDENDGRLIEENPERKMRRKSRMTYRLRWTARVGLILALALAGLFVMWLSILSSTQDGTLLTYAPPGLWPPPA